MLKRSLNDFMDVWLEDGTTQGVGYLCVSLTRVSNKNSRYDLLFLLLLSLHVCNVSLASTLTYGMINRRGSPARMTIAQAASLYLRSQELRPIKAGPVIHAQPGGVRIGRTAV